MVFDLLYELIANNILKSVERVKFRRIALAYLGGCIIVERSVVDHERGGLSKSHWRSSYKQLSDHARDAEAVA